MCFQAFAATYNWIHNDNIIINKNYLPTYITH